MNLVAAWWILLRGWSWSSQLRSSLSHTCLWPSSLANCPPTRPVLPPGAISDSLPTASLGANCWLPTEESPQGTWGKGDKQCSEVNAKENPSAPPPPHYHQWSLLFVLPAEAHILQCLSTKRCWMTLRYVRNSFLLFRDSKKATPEMWGSSTSETSSSPKETEPQTSNR